jgi:hypothetical protein
MQPPPRRAAPAASARPDANRQAPTVKPPRAAQRVTLPNRNLAAELKRRHNAPKAARFRRPTNEARPQTFNTQ